LTETNHTSAGPPSAPRNSRTGGLYFIVPIALLIVLALSSGIYIEAQNQALDARLATISSQSSELSEANDRIAFRVASVEQKVALSRRTTQL
jgi:hypothetical protein